MTLPSSIKLTDLSKKGEIRALQNTINRLIMSANSSVMRVPTSKDAVEPTTGDMFMTSGGDIRVRRNGGYRNLAYSEEKVELSPTPISALFMAEDYMVDKDVVNRSRQITTEGLRKAINAAYYNGGGYVYLGPFTYKVDVTDGPIILPSGVVLVGCGKGKTIVDGRNQPGVIFKSEGKLDSSYNLFLPKAFGADSVTITTPSVPEDLAVNADMIIQAPPSINNTTAFYSQASGSSQTPRLGMWFQPREILSLVGTTTLLLDHELITNSDDSGSYLTTDGARVARIYAVQDCGIMSMSILGSDLYDGVSGNVMCWWVRYGKNVFAHDVQFQHGSAGHCARMSVVRNGWFSKCSFRESPTTDATDQNSGESRYGISFDGASRFVGAVDSQFYKFRHQITGQSGRAEGVVADLHLHGNYFTGTRLTSVESHWAWYGLYATRNKWVNSNDQQSADSSAPTSVGSSDINDVVMRGNQHMGMDYGLVAKRARHVLIDGDSFRNFMQDHGTALWVIGNTGTVRFINNELNLCPRLMNLQKSSADTASTTILNLQIAGNSIYKYGNDMIILRQSNATQLLLMENIEITNNWVRNNSGSGTPANNNVFDIRNDGAGGTFTIQMLRVTENSFIDITTALTLNRAGTVTINDFLSRDNQHLRTASLMPTTENHVSGTRVGFADPAGDLGVSTVHAPFFEALEDAEIVDIRAYAVGDGSNVTITVDRNDVAFAAVAVTSQLTNSAAAWTNITITGSRSVRVAERFGLEFSGASAGEIEAIVVEINMARVY